MLTVSVDLGHRNGAVNNGTCNGTAVRSTVPRVDVRAISSPLLTPTNGRAHPDDASVYNPEPSEIVRVRDIPGARFTFVRYEEDSGGFFAVLLGGIPGHRLERCVTVDRIVPIRRRRRR